MMVEYISMQRPEPEKKSKSKDASRLKIGIAVSSAHQDVSASLLEGARATLKNWKVKDENVYTALVKGAFELPFAAERLIHKQKVHAVIALGCIVKGETKRDEYVARAVLDGLMRVSVTERVAVGLGVLSVDTPAQARERSEGETGAGADAAEAALTAALLK